MISRRRGGGLIYVKTVVIIIAPATTRGIDSIRRLWGRSKISNRNAVIRLGFSWALYSWCRNDALPPRCYCTDERNNFVFGLIETISTPPTTVYRPILIGVLYVGTSSWASVTESVLITYTIRFPTRRRIVFITDNRHKTGWNTERCTKLLIRRYFILFYFFFKLFNKTVSWASTVVKQSFVPEQWREKT